MAKVANALTKAIVDYLTLRGHIVWAQNNGGIWDEKKQIYRKQTASQRKGVADVCGVTKLGRGLYVETKVKDKQSDDQKAFEADINRVGAIYILAKSLDNVMNDSRI